MSRLLEVYEEMQKEAAAAEVQSNLVEMLSKYAEAAEAALAEEYGSDYDANDVASLANGLMERDAELIQEQEKVAEYDQIGRQMAKMYVENMLKEAADKTKKEVKPVLGDNKAITEKVVSDSKRGGEA
jgi:hypothetical protein